MGALLLTIAAALIALNWSLGEESLWRWLLLAGATGVIGAKLLEIVRARLRETLAPGASEISVQLGPELSRELDRRVADATAKLRGENAELARAKEVADQVLRARSDFLAGLSHEIRTPMNAVIGLASVLLGTELGAKQRALADRILRSSESLLQLLNDFLDFSRIEAGKIELESVEFSPREVVEECCDLLTHMAQSKGLELVVWVDPAVPQEVRGDPGRLRQILVNLINNAVKFTEQGFVEVELSPRDREGGGPHLQFAVRDSGIGILPEKLGGLFQRFIQADASMARKFGGCGLGLAISKRLCDVMAGEIAVASEPGRGSTFTLSLPFEPVGRSPRESELLPAELRGTRVLLVHAESEGGRVLLRQLETLGCIVSWEHSVLAALARLRSGEEDEVVLYDSALPRSAELVSRRERRRARAGTSFVRLAPLFGALVSAESPEHEASELSKPVKLFELVAALAEARGLAPLPARRVEAPVRATTSLIETRFRRRIRILVAEDEPSNQDVLRYVLAGRSYQLELVSNGLDAVDSYRAHDYDLVLMDVRMPGMDGLAATRAIRAIERERGTHVPILALTANVLREDREQCRAAGMDDHVTKPFRPVELEDRVAQWLWTRLQEHPERLLESVAPLRPHAAGALDPEVLGGLLDGTDTNGRELAASLIAGFLERTPRFLAELEAALAKGAWERCSDLAHRFVSTAGNVGAHALVRRLRDLETACKSGEGAAARSKLGAVRQEIETAMDALLELRGRSARTN